MCLIVYIGLDLTIYGNHSQTELQKFKDLDKWHFQNICSFEWFDLTTFESASDVCLEEDDLSVKIIYNFVSDVENTSP